LTEQDVTALTVAVDANALMSNSNPVTADQANTLSNIALKVRVPDNTII
jgi:hypothetical protein